MLGLETAQLKHPILESKFPFPDERLKLSPEEKGSIQDIRLKKTNNALSQRVESAAGTGFEQGMARAKFKCNRNKAETLKKRVKRASEMTTFFSLFQDLAKTIVKGISKATLGTNIQLGQAAAAMGLPIAGIDAPFSLYGIYDSVREGVKSYRIDDREGIREATAQGVQNALNLGASSLSLAAGIMEIGGNTAGIATISPALGVLGLATLGAYTVIESIKLERACTALSGLKKSMDSKAAQSPYATVGEAILHLRTETLITEEEVVEVLKKHTEPKAINREIDTINRRKKRRMIRCIGKELYNEIVKNTPRIINQLQINRLEWERKSALDEGIRLVNKCKNQIMKYIAGHIIGLVGAAIGTAALIMMLVTPLAPAVPLILLGVANAVCLGQVGFYSKFDRDNFDCIELSKNMPKPRTLCSEVAEEVLVDQEIEIAKKPKKGRIKVIKHVESEKREDVQNKTIELMKKAQVNRDRKRTVQLRQDRVSGAVAA